MLKRSVPWLLSLGLLSGCAVQDAISTLQNTMSQGVVLVRSFTIANQPHVFIFWARPNGGKLQSMKRYLGSTAYDVDISEAASQSANAGGIEDKTPGLTVDTAYSYRIRFEGSSEINRDITTLGMGGLSGKVKLSSPLTSVPPTEVSSTSATFTFENLTFSQKDRHVGYLVTVAKGSGFGEKFEPGESAVVYSALIDPEKHLNGNVVEVSMGATSDLPIDERLLPALTSATPFKPVDGKNTKQLETGETYGWSVAPLLYDTEKTSFALGDMATPQLFTVK